MTQRQMFWNMAFSERLNLILDYQKSQDFWENIKNSVADNTRSQSQINKRIEARNKQAEVCAERNRLTEEFETWVKEHPYPTD